MSKKAKIPPQLEPNAVHPMWEYLIRIQEQEGDYAAIREIRRIFGPSRQDIESVNQNK